MELQIKEVLKEGFEDLDKVDRLNRASFPDDERMDIDLIVDRSKIQKVDFYAVYLDEEFVGFFNTMVYKHTAYVLFLAVEENKRDLGIGSEILKLIAKIYEGYQVVLDLEVQDENADNASQRIRRKKFYLRNGYVETGYILEYEDVKLELLCYNTNTFDAAEYQELMNKVSNEHFRPNVYKI